MLDDLVDDLKGDEGWRPFAYQDHLDNWTIGYGFLVDERKGGRLPESIGRAWLLHLVTEIWAELTRREPWILHQPDDVQRALGNMAYQMGVDGVLGFRNTLSLLKSGQRVAAGIEALDSDWARNQTPRRARRVAALMAGIPMDSLPPTKGTET